MKHGVRNVRKVAKCCIFQCFEPPDGPEVTSVKRRVRSLWSELLAKNRTRPARGAHLEVKIVKTLHARATFGSSNFQKSHAACARCTFGSQNRKNLRGSGYFWKLQLSKIARGLRAVRVIKMQCSLTAVKRIGMATRKAFI